MSNNPAALRTARCSSTILVYCTGISQPPNSINFAPNFWCVGYNGVRFIPRTVRFAPGAVKPGSAGVSPASWSYNGVMEYTSGGPFVRCGNGSLQCTRGGGREVIL